jgi:hypothetical protein
MSSVALELQKSELHSPVEFTTRRRGCEGLVA